MRTHFFDAVAVVLAGLAAGACSSSSAPGQVADCNALAGDGSAEASTTNCVVVSGAGESSGSPGSGAGTSGSSSAGSGGLGSSGAASSGGVVSSSGVGTSGAGSSGAIGSSGGVGTSTGGTGTSPVGGSSGSI
jgi:hypothetical protein